jgi:hypothetical protein
MATLIRIHSLVLLAVTLYASAVQAQQADSAKNDPREQPATPYPAGRTLFPTILSPGSTSDSDLDISQAPTAEVQLEADRRPLSGVQELTVGSNVGVRNFLVPSVNVMSSMAMNSSVSGLDRPTTFSDLLGTLDLNHVSDRSKILLHYTGGGMISSYVNSAIQDLEFSYNFAWRRWSLLVGDQISYLSESPFGFGGVGGLAFLNGGSQFGPGGVPGPFLNASLTPNQTIPTIMVPRLSNTVVSQLEYSLSPRSSWTASGSFGMLNFLGAPYINSTEGQFQTGYNYLASPQSSIAVIYRFDAFRFTYLSQSIEDHVVQLGYGRYVTGRMSFQLAAGPSMEMLRGVVTGYGNRLSWALEGLLNYKLDRTTLLLAYDHLLTGGSGVLVGAQTGQLVGTVERELTPRWRGSATMGYATNSSLLQTTANSGAGQLNSWYVAVQLNRQLRPRTSFFLSYGARVQAINAGACATPNCGTSSVGHEVSVGFNLGLRPILFR